MRLTKAVRQQLLDLNEGFHARADYSGNNITETVDYLITGGQLQIRSRGKTS